MTQIIITRASILTCILVEKFLTRQSTPFRRIRIKRREKSSSTKKKKKLNSTEEATLSPNLYVRVAGDRSIYQWISLFRSRSGRQFLFALPSDRWYKGPHRMFLIFCWRASELLCAARLILESLEEKEKNKTGGKKPFKN